MGGSIEGHQAGDAIAIFVDDNPMDQSLWALVSQDRWRRDENRNLCQASDEFL